MSDDNVINLNREGATPHAGFERTAREILDLHAAGAAIEGFTVIVTFGANSEGQTSSIRVSQLARDGELLRLIGALGVERARLEHHAWMMQLTGRSVSEFVPEDPDEGPDPEEGGPAAS